MKIMCVFFILLVVSCGVTRSKNHNRDWIVVSGRNSAQPILTIIDIPSDAFITKIVGKVSLLNQKNGKYKIIEKNILLRIDDIIRLEKKAIVVLYFLDDGSYLTLGPESKIKWFKFQ